MNCVELNAKDIDKVCFDSDTKELLVYFYNGDINVFISFNEEIFDDFINSSDPDSYYRRNLFKLPHEIRR